MSAWHILGRGPAFAWSTGAAGVVQVVLLAVASGGCQLILDDIETSDAAFDDRKEDAGADDTALEDGEVRGMGQGSSDGGRGSPARDAASGGTPGGGGAQSGTDAGSDGQDSGTDTTSPGELDAAGGGGAEDGSTPVRDGDPTCSQLVWWYADDDADGYGRASSSVNACAAPAGGSWALNAGDCNDDDMRVHPDQLEFFDEAYRGPDGSESFDYDCSGDEEGNDQQAAAPTSCGPLEIAACTGSGYLPTARPGLNPLCGSHRTMTCQATTLGLLFCDGIIQDVREPYWCH